jgi:hypothetical protein
MNVEDLYMAITCLTFFVFVLNVDVINSAPKMVNVLSDDKWLLLILIHLTTILTNLI